MSQGIFSDPSVWVALAFVLLVAGLYKKIARSLAEFLDARSAKITQELETARKLRLEAEEVLAIYKQKQADYVKEAESILRKAREDADHIAAHADQELKKAMQTRTQHAMEKIAQEEARALVEVRAHIVDISLAAARAVVIQHIEATPQQDLLKLALADIDRKLH